jgi:hypothetical protein
MPAIFQQSKDEEIIIPRKGVPYIWHMHVLLVIYISTNSDQDQSSTMILNPILDQLESLFPSDNQPQTLGGIVSYCRIHDKIEIFEDLVDKVEMCTVSIEIESPS